MYCIDVPCLSKPNQLLVPESVVQNYLKLPLPMPPSPHPQFADRPPSGSESTAYENPQLPGDLSVRTDPLFPSKPCAPLFLFNCEFSSSKHPRQCIPECRNFKNNY